MEKIYTLHAEDKLSELNNSKLTINKDLIELVIEKPKFKENLPNSVIRVTGNLDQEHSLVVVIKIESGKIKVITFFPVKKGRYES